MTVATGRVCAREGCGASLAGKRADARFCGDTCRNLAGRRSRSDPIRSRGTGSRPAVISPARADLVIGWDPGGQPRQPYPAGENCPECGQVLLAGPRGTWRACPGCRRAVVPAAVRAPYAAGPGPAQRRVISQRDRDLAAIALAQRKGVMLAQLGELAADDRLHPESAPVVEWFTGEVKTASTQARLDELAGLLPHAGIRRRRWWQGQPAAGPPGWDDDGDEDQAEDGEERPRAIEAGPVAAAARPREMTAADALDALGWRLTPSAGGCQVVKADSLCGAEARHHISGRWVRQAWVCNPCYQAVCKVIRDAERLA